jgi:hypothetical protein
MDPFSIALGLGTFGAGIYGSQQQADAQRDANRANKDIAKRQRELDKYTFDTGLAENQRQFDRSTEIGQNQYQNQFNLTNAQNQYGANQFNVSGQYGADVYAGQQGELAQRKADAIAGFDPYTSGGAEATNQMRALLGLSGDYDTAMSKFNESPGQKFLRDRQEKALLRNAAATGGLRGGRTQTALQSQAFDRAQTDYGNYYNRLSGLSGQGQSAQSQLATMSGGASTPDWVDAEYTTPEYISTDFSSLPTKPITEHKTRPSPTATPTAITQDPNYNAYLGAILDRNAGDPRIERVSPTDVDYNAYLGGKIKKKTTPSSYGGPGSGYGQSGYGTYGGNSGWA